MQNRRVQFSDKSGSKSKLPIHYKLITLIYERFFTAEGRRAASIFLGKDGGQVKLWAHKFTISAPLPWQPNMWNANKSTHTVLQAGSRRERCEVSIGEKFRAKHRVLMQCTASRHRGRLSFSAPRHPAMQHPHRRRRRR